MEHQGERLPCLKVEKCCADLFNSTVQQDIIQGVILNSGTGNAVNLVEGILLYTQGTRTMAQTASFNPSIDIY